MIFLKEKLMSKKVSFIVSNYATKGLLDKFVNNLLSAWENCEIIIVDNDSPDQSADYIEDHFSKETRVILIRNKNNGLAAGYNLGMDKASGDYYVFLGTDAFPTKQSLESIIAYLEDNPQTGIVTPKLYLRDGAEDKDAHRGFITPWTAITHFLYLDRLFPKSKIFNQYSLGYLDFNKIQEIDACISHFMAVNPKIFEKIGKWDEEYFLFGEDIDMCYRTKKAGFKIIYLGDVKVLHYKGAGIGRAASKDIENAMNMNFSQVSFKDEVITRDKVKNTSKWMRIKIAKESSKAMKIFYKKHYIDKYPKCITSLVFLGIWINEKIKVLKVSLK